MYLQMNLWVVHYYVFGTCIHKNDSNQITD